MNITYNQGSTHHGHNIEKGVIVNQGMSLEDVEALKACVKQNGVSADGKDIADGETVDYYITVKNTSSKQADITVEDQVSKYLEIKILHKHV